MFPCKELLIYGSVIRSQMLYPIELCVLALGGNVLERILAGRRILCQVCFGLSRFACCVLFGFNHEFLVCNYPRTCNSPSAMRRMSVRQLGRLSAVVMAMDLVFAASFSSAAHWSVVSFKDSRFMK